MSERRDTTATVEQVGLPQATEVATFGAGIFEDWYAAGSLLGVEAHAIPGVGDGKPPWDIDGPQPAIVRLAEAGQITGSVLDVGCGTGENALFLAARGLEVVGLDSSPTALEKARSKARARGLTARFVRGDALDLARLGEAFDTVIDSGLLHVFSDADRARLVAGLRTVVRPGGRYHLLCFGERATLPGPRRLTQADIRASFTGDWQVESIAAARFEIRGGIPGGEAWLACIRRV